MDRRKFLFRSGIAIGGTALLPACQTDSAKAPAASETPISFETWEDIRQQFLFSKDRIHMSQMLLAAHPRSVRDAIEKHRKGFDENPVEYWENGWITMEADIRKEAGKYMDALPEEIALTDSTTMGLSIMYSGLKLKPGDEILTTTYDHYATELALHYAAAKSGATVKRVLMYKDAFNASVEEMVGTLKNGVTNATRVIAITFVHSCTGMKTPVKDIAAMVRDLNGQRKPEDRIYLCVDGVHGFGIEDVSMHDLGCDFFAAGTHKWIFGPRGTGVLYARKDAWDFIAPIIPSFESNAYGSWLDLYPREKLTYGELCTPGGFHSFEHRWALGDAFQFQMKIGKTRVAERSHQLSTRLKQGLSQIKHVKLITPVSESLSAGINCFEIDGMKPDDAVKKLLEKRIIASSSPYKTSYVRLTPSIINSEEEVDVCLREVEQIKG
jgi:selenocysteine lyase/cysteine desulfurase